ncbi:DUF6276 family protein [Salinirarus marinus]|uniref:DUF6276 family protein n=1 Tax=Salinirarus marinus TaxID=3068310 RepID=UPI003C6BF159
MSCPECDGPTVSFSVPSDLLEYAPEESAHAAICTVCLRTHPADAGETDPSFDAVLDDFPSGDAGVALALALGKLGSLALNRADVVSLCERAEREGADVLLTLDRLAVAGSVEPHFDIDRRRPQLAGTLED